MLETYVLHITKECNMSCTYCYEEDKGSVYSWDEIRGLLEKIVSLNKHFVLEFLGGEPCLRVDLIKKAVDYLESLPDIRVERYAITTNGTIVTDELKEVMRSCDRVYWHPSIDGNKFMNSLRVMKDGHNSYDVVVKNIQEMLKLFGEDRIGVHLVTHPYNINCLRDGVHDLYGHGVRLFGIGTVEKTIVIDDAYCAAFIEQHRLLSGDVKVGRLDAMISSFSGVKPKTDSRHYIKDASGKTVLETYGRAQGDIKDDPGYRTPAAGSPLGDKIFSLRDRVYTEHHRA